MSDRYIETSEQYHSGFKVDEYKGKISLTAARTWNGEVKLQWAKQEFGKEKVEKNLPVKVEIGNTKDEAIANLLLVIGMLQGEAENNRPFPDDDDVPF